MFFYPVNLDSETMLYSLLFVLAAFSCGLACWFFLIYIPRHLAYRGEFYLLTKNKQESRVQRKWNLLLVHELIDGPSVLINNKDRKRIKGHYRKWQKKEKELFSKHAKGSKLELLKQSNQGIQLYSDSAFKKVEHDFTKGKYKIFMEGVFSDMFSEGNLTYFPQDLEQLVREKIECLAVLLDVMESSSKDIVFVKRHILSSNSSSIVMFDIYRKIGSK